MLQSPQAMAASTGALLRTATAYTYPPSPATPQTTWHMRLELVEVAHSSTTSSTGKLVAACNNGEPSLLDIFPP